MKLYIATSMVRVAVSSWASSLRSRLSAGEYRCHRLRRAGVGGQQESQKNACRPGHHARLPGRTGTRNESKGADHPEQIRASFRQSRFSGLIGRRVL